MGKIKSVKLLVCHSTDGCDPFNYLPLTYIQLGDSTAFPPNGFRVTLPFGAVNS